MSESTTDAKKVQKKWNAGQWRATALMYPAYATATAIPSVPIAVPSWAAPGSFAPPTAVAFQPAAEAPTAAPPRAAYRPPAYRPLQNDMD